MFVPLTVNFTQAGNEPGAQLFVVPRYKLALTPTEGKQA